MMSCEKPKMGVKRLLASGAAAEKEEELKKYRRALNRKGRYEQLIPAARARVAAAEGIAIRGENASLAAAEMQSLIEGLTQAADISVSQRTVSNPKKIDDYYDELSMTLNFDATPSQLLSFLTAIKGAPKFLTVRSFQAVPTQPLTEAPRTGEYRKTIRVTVTVSALLAKGQA